MPPADAAWLLGILFEVGPTQSGGMGPSPLTETEIASWQQNTGVRLSAWESRSLRRLSGEYLAECQRAAKPECACPWDEAPYARPSEDFVALSLKQSINDLMKL